MRPAKAAPDRKALMALNFQALDLDGVRKVASVLAGWLESGDLVLLEGDLGTGKTEFARAVLRHLSNDEGLEVPSPSYALVQPYEMAGRSVLHADLYRLGSEAEADELGLFDDPEAIVLIEWPQRAPGLLRRAGFVVALGQGPSAETRTLGLGVFAAASDRAAGIERAMADIGISKPT